MSQLNQYGKHTVTGGLMAGRLEAGKPKTMPSPADYSVKPARETIGPRMVPRRRCPPRRAQMPAPNAYLLPSTLAGRSAGLGKRFEATKSGQSSTPGPGQYDVPHADVYLPGRFRAGRTLGKRFRDARASSTPGPADYDPPRLMNCCRCEKGGVCRPTFGYRRPDTTVLPFAVVADNDDNCCCA